jgi:Putative binding domain, N-terminal/Viral BACON domain
MFWADSWGKAGPSSAIRGGMKLNRILDGALLPALVAAFLTVGPLDRDAYAQTVVDPNTAEFSPSTDHNAVLSDGTPVVQSYQLELYLIGATSPFRVASLGKPAPQTDGKIRVGLSTVLNPLPQAGVAYFADVAAVGPGGTSRSTASNQFSWSVPCTYGVTPTSQSVSSSASTNNNITVTAGTGCMWTAVSNATWITVTAGASGAGNGTATYSVVANTSTSQRTGSLTVAGQPVSVTQSGVTCSFTISPTSQSIASGGGPGTASVTASSGSCQWTATSSAGWITINSGSSSGTGSGTVGYTVAANTTTSARSASLTIAGRTLTVSQAVASAPAAPSNVRVVTN